MIKKLQILLLLPLVVLPVALLYRLNPTPNKTNEQPRGMVVEASPAAISGSFTDADFARHVEQLKKKLPGNEFAVVIRETQLGRPRLEALEDMGKRCGVVDLNNFVQSIIQSEQMGVGIAKILRIQSQELRRKRRQRAQETAAQATLKMMLPMVGCIFPTIWIILLGPAVLVIIKARS